MKNSTGLLAAVTENSTSAYVDVGDNHELDPVVQVHTAGTPDFSFRILTHDHYGNPVLVHDEDVDGTSPASFEVRIPGCHYDLAVEVYNYASGTPSFSLKTK